MILIFIPAVVFFAVVCSADQRANQHLHDPDRRARQPPERPGHAHAADQGLHAGGGELHREVPTMHHGGLHDVPHHQVIGSSARRRDPTRRGRRCR